MSAVVNAAQYHNPGMKDQFDGALETYGGVVSAIDVRWGLRIINYRSSGSYLNVTMSWLKVVREAAPSTRQEVLNFLELLLGFDSKG